MTEKEYFLTHVTFLYDTREKDNFAVLKTFAHFGVAARREKFDTADYSFEIDGKSYKTEWLAERKGSLEEVYNNIMAHSSGSGEGPRNNLEKEAVRANESGVCEFIMFLQGCANLEELQAWKHPKATRQGNVAGQHIYSTLMSWQSNNRYGFKISCAQTQEKIATQMIAYAYYYWRNDMKKLHGKDFLKKILGGRKDERTA